MTSKGFSLRFLLGTTALVCISAAARAVPSATSLLGSVIVWSVAGAWWGRRRGNAPVRYGVAAGAMAALLILLSGWAGLYLGYESAGLFGKHEVTTEALVYFALLHLVFVLGGAGIGAVVGIFFAAVYEYRSLDSASRGK
jgi:hypothetical protein